MIFSFVAKDRSMSTFQVHYNPRQTFISPHFLATSQANKLNVTVTKSIEIWILGLPVKYKRGNKSSTRRDPRRKYQTGTVCLVYIFIALVKCGFLLMCVLTGYILYIQVRKNVLNKKKILNKLKKNYCT